jgi:hypothetical protein
MNEQHADPSVMKPRLPPVEPVIPVPIDTPPASPSTSSRPVLSYMDLALWTPPSETDLAAWPMMEPETDEEGEEE